jgi:hypothetical protein
VARSLAWILDPTASVAYRFYVEETKSERLIGNLTACDCPYPFAVVIFLKSPFTFIQSTRRPVRGLLCLRDFYGLALDFLVFGAQSRGIIINIK